MKIENIKIKEANIAVVSSEEKLIADTQSALDFIMTVKYETNADRIVINKEAVSEEFFILSTGIAGEILQKFINYQVKIAIYGDYTKYTSKPLKDFIYESNCGKDFLFHRYQRRCNRPIKRNHTVKAVPIPVMKPCEEFSPCNERTILSQGFLLRLQHCSHCTYHCKYP